MAYLDFFLKDNGRIEYSKDLSINQYSNKVDTIRLLTKNSYDIVNMNVTLPNNISTTKKILIQQPIKENEYWVYSYPVDLSMTDFEMASDKAIIRVGFFLYPDVTDQSIVNTTGVCFIPIIRNTESAKPDGSITESDLNTLTGEINEINEKLENLNLGELDTAKNYNISEGTIKEKFDLVDASIGNVSNITDLLESKLGSLDIELGESISDSLLDVRNGLEELRTANENLDSRVDENTAGINTLRKNIETNSSNISTVSSQVSTLSSRVSENTNKITSNTNEINTLKNTTIPGVRTELKGEIDEIKNDILPTLQAGLKYEIVTSLPNNPKNGVVYLVKNEGLDSYTEYLYINGQWEELGRDGEIDLADYYTSQEVDNKLSTEYYSKANIDNKLTGYYTTTQADSQFAKKSTLNNYYTIDSANSRFVTNSTLENNYYTKTLANQTFALKSSIPTKVSQLSNDSAYIKNEKNAFSYDNLKDAPAIPKALSELTNDADYITTEGVNNLVSPIYATKTELSTLESKVTENAEDIKSNQTYIEQVEISLGETSEIANTALVLATAKQYSKVFETKEAMIEYIQVKQTDPIAIGTELIIKDHDVSDYWISAIYSEPRTYTTKFGEVFENVYYGVEESESKIDLSAYATYDYVNTTHSNEIKRYVDEKDALKVDLSAKSSVISDASTDTQWASALAVKNYVSATKETIDKDIADNSTKISALETNLNETNETIEANKSEQTEKNTEVDSRLDTHDSQIGTLITDLETEETNRKSEDTAIRTSITQLDTKVENYKTEINTSISTNVAELESKLETHKTEAEERFLDYSETISKSESIVDYVDSKNLKFTTDSTQTEFTISNIDMENLISVLSMFGPNEYN